jgi:hypothetical protein
MKKKMYALSGIFMIVLVISGLWATKAINLTDVGQTAPAETSLVAGMSMEQMVQGSSNIVFGKCLGTQSQWAGRNLFTMATVEVTESLKGDMTGTVTVAIPGGADFNRSIPIAVTVPGAPQMQDGEAVALFLTPQGEIPNAYSVVGLSEGKFSIAETDAGEKVVMRDSTRARVQTGSGPTRGNPQAIRVPEFRAMVQKYLN